MKFLTHICTLLGFVFILSMLTLPGVKGETLRINLVKSEDCQWTLTRIGVSKVRLTLRNAPTTSDDATCLFELSSYQNLYFAMVVKSFSLVGSDVCGDDSEKFSLHIEPLSEVPDHWPKTVSWCGQMRPDYMVLPRKVKVVYHTGRVGRGEGFEMEFKAVSKSRAFDCDTNPTISVGGEHGKLLYAPGYPFEVLDSLQCSWEIQALSMLNDNILIRLLAFGIKSERGSCDKDYLRVGDEKYCDFDSYAKEFLHVESGSTTIELSVTSAGFSAGSHQEMALEVISGKSRLCRGYQIDPVDSLPEPTVLTANVDEVTYCHLQFDSGSDDKIIEYTLFSEISRLKFVCGYGFFRTGAIYLEDDDGKAFNLCSHPIKRFRSSGRRLAFTFRRSRSSMNFRRDLLMSFQTQAKSRIPETLLSSWPSAVPLSQLLTSSTNGNLHLQLGLDPSVVDKASENVSTVIKIYNHNWTERIPPSDVLKFFNGPDASYFELTKDCNGRLRVDLTLYSYSTWVVTLQFLPTVSSENVWLMFLPVKSQAIYTHLPGDGLIEFRADLLPSVKNIHCFWRVSALHGVNSTQAIKPLRIDDGLEYQMSEILVGSYTKTRQPPLITSSVFNETKNKWIFSNHSIDVYVKQSESDTPFTSHEAFQAESKVMSNPNMEA